MKKALAIILAVGMLSMVLAGCGGGTGTESPAPSTQPSSAAPAGGSETTPPAETAEATEPGDTEEPISGVEHPTYGLATDYFKNLPSDNNVIKPADLFAMMDAGDDMLILDIRRPEDYAEGHLKGAVNLSFFDMSIPDNLAKLPDDKPIMVYCYTGQTASQVTVLLNIAGKTAKNIQSGFNGGISKADGFDAYIDTEEVALPDGSYEVDEVVAGAIGVYFEKKNELEGSKMANYNIAPESVKEIVDAEDDQYYILSVRQAEDYATGHIKGAANIPFGQGMEEGLMQLPTDKIIIVYCYSGQTSSQTMAVLRMMGYDAYSMSGGMGSAEAESGWLGAGYEVVTD